MFYSPSTKGFYTPGQRNTPDDAVKITKRKYRSLLQQQEKGREIVFRGGNVVAIEREISWIQIRARRAKLLRDTDWTQLPDAQAAFSAERAEEWRDYRQELRDITDSFASPDKVTWPVAPGEN